MLTSERREKKQGKIRNSEYYGMESIFDTLYGLKRRAGRIKRRACYPFIRCRPCAFQLHYSMLYPLLERKAVKTAFMTGSNVWASSSLHSLTRA